MVALAPSPLEALSDSATYKHQSSQDLPIYIHHKPSPLGIPTRTRLSTRKSKAVWHGRRSR